MKTRRGAPIAAIILLLGWGAVARAGVAPAKDDGTSDADDPAGDQTAAATGGDAAGDANDNPGLITPHHHEGAEVRAGHYHQLGIGFQFALGMRAINPYQDGAFCGTRGDNGGANQAYCLARTPAALDLELSYGVKPSIEVLMEIRLGLERDFGAVAGATGPRVHQFSPGGRFFFAETGRAKFFSTVQMLFDTTGYMDAAGQNRGLDIGIRNVNGFWLDLHHAYGAYVFFGEEAGFKRWLSAEMEVGLGIQGRYP